VDKNQKMTAFLSLVNQNRNRILMLFVFGIIGMQGACNMSPESPFFAKFSMQDLVTANKSMAGIDCEPMGGGGGGNGIGSRSGGLGRGGFQFQSHKSDSFACRLQSDSFASADEDRLIASLKKPVEDSLRKYGANIKESGSRNPRSFYVSYTINDIQGRIQVSSQRIGVDFYNLQADLEESK
jgi:hypothetical protein